MTAKEIFESCKINQNFTNIKNFKIYGDESNEQLPSKPKERLAENQLRPLVLSVLLKNKTEAFSPQLRHFCLKQPIVVIRGIAPALGIELGVFSTKILVSSNPNQKIEVRRQRPNSKDSNLDRSGQSVWSLVSENDYQKMTIEKYGTYQVLGFSKHLKDGTKNVSTPSTIMFGTNVDMSNEVDWNYQLKELQKLPSWAQVSNSQNMLTYVHDDILGMNTVQIYLKVPGSRTPGHQENNNFCSVNINVGPGDCEWFAVPNEYWMCVHKLCEKNGIDYLSGSWWPNLQELYDEGCPVYRFTQKPGEMVWVNSGCVHWVQALGFCNNIAWNVGPLSATQYRMAIERYEWNRLKSYKSIVPMVYLTWNLAIEVPIADESFFNLIRNVLKRSLTYCIQVLDFVKMKNVEVQFDARKKNGPSKYCVACQVEIFQTILALGEHKLHHCIVCALICSKDLIGFVCLQEYHLNELFSIYDNFTLHQDSKTTPQLQ